MLKDLKEELAELMEELESECVELETCEFAVGHAVMERNDQLRVVSHLKEKKLDLELLIIKGEKL